LRVWQVIEEHFEQIHSAVMDLPRTLVYTDFHYTNLAVARDGSSVLIFDYNFFFKSYAYSDIRNVFGNFYNEEAKVAFLSTYSSFNEREVVVDNVASVLSALLIACQRKVFPDWAKGLLEKVKDGKLLTSVEEMLEIPIIIPLDKLPENAYFIWGSGKTTAANELARRFGCYVYHTDDNRAKHFANANPQLQPAMCRNVPDYWVLDPADALQWEHDIIREMTPMIIADLTDLAVQHKVVICEGDIDIDLIVPLSMNIVYISNHGKKYDFFDRPEQRHMLDEIRNRSDLAEAEKEQRIQNAYAIVVGGENPEKPREVTQLGVKEIIRDDNTIVEQTADEIAKYFQFEIWYHGSPFELTELATGSTITRWRELADAFSHKPQILNYDTVGGNINHNGQLNGYLYVVDEPINKDLDIYRHPRTTMDEGVEWLTKRPLRLRKISESTE
jgi:hypothetical protein